MVCRRKIAITAAPPTNKTKSAALGPSINDISRERGGDWPIPDQKKKNCLELTEAGKKIPKNYLDVIHGWPLGEKPLRFRHFSSFSSRLPFPS